MIRTFLAFDLPESIRQRIIEIKDTLINVSARKIKWVEDENIHITLQFIGDINEWDISDLATKFGYYFLNLKPLKFKFSKLELVPGRNPKIIWLKFETDSTDIFKMHKKIRNYLFEKGYKTDKKPLKFHITLGRIKRELNYFEIENLIKIKPQLKDFLVDDITFYKSLLTPKGPIYTPLENYVLKEKGDKQ